MRPAGEVMPDLVRRMGRGPQKSPTKKRVTIRLDESVIEHFRKDGKGWQSRMNDFLVRSVGK